LRRLEYTGDAPWNDVVNLAMVGPWRERNEQQPPGARVRFGEQEQLESGDETVAALVRLHRPLRGTLADLRVDASSPGDERRSTIRADVRPPATMDWIESRRGDRMLKKKTGDLASRYLESLGEEGYRPRLESSDDRRSIIGFKSEGLELLLFVDEDDDSFFHLGSAYQLGETDLESALSRANELDEELKVVKITIAPEDRSVRFHVESFVEEAPPGAEHVERAVGAIRNAVSLFFESRRTADHLDA
jgi:hypothetical protein